MDNAPHSRSGSERGDGPSYSAACGSMVRIGRSRACSSKTCATSPGMRAIIKKALPSSGGRPRSTRIAAIAPSTLTGSARPVTDEPQAVIAWIDSHAAVSALQREIDLVDRINESGMSLYDAVDQRLDTLTERITTSGEGFAELLDTRIARLTQTSDEASRTLSQMLDERTTGMVSLLSGATSSLNSELDARLENIEATLRERTVVTRDVGGTAGTDEYTDAVIARLKG